MLQQPLSKTTHQKAFGAVSLTLACGVLMFSGCQSMKTKFASMPKLPSASNLAFWKKESGSLPPPPPAQHLNPSPTDGIFNGSKAALAQRGGDDVDDYQRKIDEIKNGIASTKNKMAESFGNNQPMRSPYGSNDSELEDKSNSFKSDFQSAGNSIDERLARAKEMGANSLSDAQKKFNAAVADTKQASFDGGGGFKSPADILSTKPSNDFKNTLAEANAKLKASANSALKNSGLNQPLAKVNNTLYDMNGNLTNGASKISKTAESNVDAARQRFSSALGSVSDRAIGAAKSSKEFGGNLKDKIVSAAAEVTSPTRGGDNSFKPSFTRAAESANKGAQNLLGKAKEKVAGLGSGFDYPGGNKPAPLFGEVAAKQTRVNEFAPSKPAPKGIESDGTFGRTRVANVTPATTSQPRSGLSSSLTKAWNDGEKQSQLQPIQVGPPTTAPGNGLRTAAVQSNNFGRPAASSIPAAFDQGYNAMTSHVSEIDIPGKILSGSGSYAPGSVNKVR